MTSELILDVEAEHIARERIVVNDGLVPDEYFCPICDGLLWKPRSCASCQHLFCLKCIRTWLNKNMTSCPFRCTPYEERRAPPHIYSMLARLQICCRNAPFGCTHVLSYGSLEQHENTTCRFLTKRCRVCEQLVLVSHIDQHQKVCSPSVLQCPLCQCAVEPTLFQSHHEQCMQQRMNQLQEQNTELPNNMDGTVALPQEPGNGDWITRGYNQAMADRVRVPTINLPGIQRIFQARQHGRIAQMWPTLILILLNLSTAPYILYILLFSGIGLVASTVILGALSLQTWVDASIYKAFAFIIVCSGLMGFSFPLLLPLVSDTVTISMLITGLIVLGSTNQYLNLNALEMSCSHIAIGSIYLAVIFVVKLALLFVRFYFFHVPPYVTAACLAWITIFLTFHERIPAVTYS